MRQPKLPKNIRKQPVRTEIPREWTFRTAEIAQTFDSHVREQLPWYDLATGIVSHVARHYVPDGGVVVDVGAATGNVGRAISETVVARTAKLVAIDNSPSMVNAYRGIGEAVVADVRSFDFAALRPDLIVCFLVLMFVPLADRAETIGRMRDALRPGGALLVVEKMASVGGYVGTMLYRLTLAAKYEAGAPPDEVIAKELSLAGHQRPLEEDELSEFVPVFRFGDFAGFLYEAPAGLRVLGG